MGACRQCHVVDRVLRASFEYVPLSSSNSSDGAIEGNHHIISTGEHCLNGIVLLGNAHDVCHISYLEVVRATVERVRESGVGRELPRVDGESVVDDRRVLGQIVSCGFCTRGVPQKVNACIIRMFGKCGAKT